MDLTIIQHIDTLLFTFFNCHFTNLVLNYFFVTITDLNFWIIPGSLAALVYIKKEKRHALIVLGLVLIAVAISDPFSSQIIKPIFERHRPCHPDTYIAGTHMLLGFKNSDSFPSSHATNMFAAAMVLSFFYSKKRIYFFTFASVIGFSRIYVGVHYPFDVLGGAVLGILIGTLVYGIYKYLIWLRNKQRFKLQEMR